MLYEKQGLAVSYFSEYRHINYNSNFSDFDSTFTGPFILKREPKNLVSMRNNSSLLPQHQSH